MRQMVDNWFGDFKRCRINTDDAERFRRSNHLVEQKNLKKVVKIVVSNNKVKLQEITSFCIK